MGVLTPHTHDGSEPLVKPAPPNGHPGQWIIIGPRVRAQMGVQLERAMPLVWLALLETTGAPEGQEWRLVIDGAHLEPVTRPES